jgi:glutamate synthase domain-containing protein 3
MPIYDIEADGLRGLNAALHQLSGTAPNEPWEVVHPKGSHAIAVGLDAPIDVTVRGSTGYYCGGMNKQATIRVAGSVGPGVAENMMSGTVIVEGDASQYAGATGHGGLLVIKGNASSRCGISMKGIDIVVHGYRAHVGLHGAGGQPRRVRRRGRGAGRQPCTKRGFSCGARSRASAPIAWKRRCGQSIWSFSPTC